MNFSKRAIGLAKSWSGLDLVTQYAIAAALVIGLGMGAFGWWVSARIEKDVVSQAAMNAALHLDSFVEPRIQELATGETIGQEAKSALKALTSVITARETVSEIAIWDRNGKRVFSTADDEDPPPTVSTQGSRPVPKEVAVALTGEVASNLDIASIGSQASQSRPGGATLKIFAPMHKIGTHELVAVAELHEAASSLVQSLRYTRFETAGILALVSLLMVGTLLGIVRQGGHTIEQQQQALSQRVGELSSLLAENDDLQRRISEINRRSIETNDRILKRISAELHDGPVQLIALALLRLEGVRPLGDPEGRNEADNDFDAIEIALRDALKEIRGMSSGLSLPKLEGVSVAEAIDYAVRNHERRSRTRVKINLSDDLPGGASALFLTCVYRFVQEGLNNAFRHAGGKEQVVQAHMDDDQLVVEVRDGGPGIVERPLATDTKGLGLIGLTDRIETLGGNLDIVNADGVGTCLRARFGKSALESLSV